MPAEWIRKQTLTQAERYITEELKELEAKILDAQERTASLELACFHSLVQAAAEHIGDLQQNAHVIGALDALTGLAQVAIDNDYVRPRLNDAQGIQIKTGATRSLNARSNPANRTSPTTLHSTLTATKS